MTAPASIHLLTEQDVEDLRRFELANRQFFESRINARPPAYNPGSPNFKDATRYVDAKISYKITPNIEVFLEGRNLNNAATSNSQGAYVPFSDGTPSILDYSYAGRRIMTGANFRFGG